MIGKKLASIALAVTVLSGLTGCANDPLAEQYRAGTDKNYVAGDGTVSEFAEANRKPAVEWSGTTADGSQLSSANLSGVVTVMNFWYAECAPCREEAPTLVELEKQFQSQGVQFVGVNVRDTSETALAFARNFKINWPNVIDYQNADVLLAFTGIVSPNAVPTTLVIDSKGRVSARVFGLVEKSTLKALIKTVLDEKAKSN